MSNGQNPNQIIQQMLNQNPQAQILFNQMNQSGMSPKEFTIQYAKQNNINIDAILNSLMQRGIKF
jgi:hypothetical protein